jgi:gamma-glutamylputrescine oxidase
MTGHADSYYAATANPHPEYPALEGNARCDVAVIGAGYTGLSAALNLAERGYDVIVLEANRVGWGASGRNGGLLGSGQRKDVRDLERRFGRDTARRLWQLAEEAKRIVKSRIARHRIACDLKPGQLAVAAKSAHAADLEASVEHLARHYDYAHVRYVPRAELREMLGTAIYHGGALDADAAHLHPLNYALGLAAAAAAAGVRIFTNTRVLRFSDGPPARIVTAAGAVEADFVVLACNGYLDALEPRIAAWMMPINNFVLATAPLGEARARSLIRDDVGVHDTLFVINYFRLSADRRLLFGGGETYTRRFPPDLKRFLRRYMLRVFPQLEDVGIDYAWGGRVAITMTRVPHFGRLGPNVFFAHGYSGHGIPIASLAGALIAEAMAGTAERFDVFAHLELPSFPGGTWLRWPALVLGMLYYSLRDKL